MPACSFQPAHITSEPPLPAFRSLKRCSPQHLSKLTVSPQAVQTAHFQSTMCSKEPRRDVAAVHAGT
eukprot:352561-Chlamydomonas_euryale.AAC.8